MRLRSAAFTDIGLRREENEDRFLCDGALGLYGVADGIGGLPAGAEAAACATQTLAKLIAAQPTEAPLDLVGLVHAANEAVVQLSQKLSPLYGMGCTLTLGVVRQELLHLVHVGDSRAYLFSKERFTPLTEDHSVENEARRARNSGKPFEYATANRNALTRCIGQQPPPEVDLLTYPLQPGDRYLFCTDGITHLIPDQELASQLHHANDPEEVARALVALANQRGGYDNATCVVLFVEAEAAPAVPSV